MDAELSPVVAAAVAAGIPATLAAVTFVFTQVSIRRATKRTAHREAFMALYTELEKVSQNFVLPAVVGALTKPDRRVAYATQRIALEIRPKDYALWLLLMGMTLKLGKAEGMARVAVASQVQGIIISHLTTPKRVRRQVPELGRKYEVNVDWRSSSLT